MGGEEFEDGGAQSTRTTRSISRAARALRRGQSLDRFPDAGLACVAAIAFVTLISPRYTGVAKILLENQESYFTRPDKATAEPAREFRSRRRAEPGRDRRPPPSWRARRSIALRSHSARIQSARFRPTLWRCAWSLVSGGRAGTPEDRRRRRLSRSSDGVPVAKSRVLQIEFSSADPALAAQGANAVAELYLDSTGARPSATRPRPPAPGWRKIEELRGKVAEAERRSRRSAPAPGCSPGPTA